MDMKKIIKSIIVTLGIISLFGGFMVANEILSSMLFVGAVFCSLLAHFIYTNQAEPSVIRKPLGTPIQPLRDEPPIPPQQFKNIKMPLPPAVEPATFDSAVEVEEDEEPERKQKGKKGGKFCGECGTNNSKTRKFCLGCGLELD